MDLTCYRCETWPCRCPDGITLIHGDCREVLPELEAGSVDVVVTDPPYGVNWKSGFNGKRGTAEVIGDTSTAVRDWVLSWWGDGPAIVFGTWKAARPEATKALLVWDKGPHVGSGDLTMPWKPNAEEIYILGQGFSGHRGSCVLSYFAPSPNFGNIRLHPNEKPTSLLAELISKCPGGLILDPFAGSGTTLRAAKDLGRKAIGIEIEEKYVRIAAERLRQGVLNFTA